MKLILKIFFGIVLSVIVLAVGCSALFSEALDDDAEKSRISQAQFDQMQVGATTRAQVLEIALPAVPASENRSTEDTGEGERVTSDCLTFRVEGGGIGDRYELCFEGETVSTKRQY